MVANGLVSESFYANVDANPIADFFDSELLKYILVTLNKVTAIDIVRYSQCQHSISTQ